MHWKTRGRIAGFALLAVSFVSANAGFSSAPRSADAAPGAGSALSAGHADFDMSAAELNARRHLDRFFAQVLDGRGAASSDAAVKVALPLPDGGTALLWIAPFAPDGERFVGVLTPQQRDVGDYRVGDLIAFGRDQVRDWSFFGEDGKMYGSYTTRVLLAALDPAMTAGIADILSDEPLPADW